MKRQALIVKEYFKDSIVPESIEYSTQELAALVPQSDGQHIVMPKIKITNMDTLNAAHLLQSQVPGNKVGVLNFGSGKRPGGGWEGHAVAQEECLFRRTNFFKTLTSKFYTRYGTTSIIVSPEITVHYDDQHDPYPEDFKVCGVTAVAKKLERGSQFTQEDIQFTSQLIINSLCGFATQGCRNVVLGALGCGVFCNPSIDVANMFRAAVCLYKQYFDNVWFAIYISPGSKRDQVNYDSFVYSFSHLKDCYIECDEPVDNQDDEAVAHSKRGRKNGRKDKMSHMYLDD